jgi:hypothetical protein
MKKRDRVRFLSSLLEMLQGIAHRCAGDLDYPVKRLIQFQN